MGMCYNCGDEGLPGGCPVCGKDSKKLNVPQKKKERFIKNASFKQIPNEYIGVVWSEQILRDNHPDLSNNGYFDNYCKILTRLHDSFLEGRIPASSVFISAPSKFSKNIFAYSCMQQSLNHGIEVSPFIDTVELKRLLTLCGDRPDWKLYGYIDYEKYITSPVCFCTVSKLDAHREAYTVISELMARRTRLGLPTFIISKFSLAEISRNCIDPNYSGMVDELGSENALKFPTIIEYN